MQLFCFFHIIEANHQLKIRLKLANLSSTKIFYTQEFKYGYVPSRKKTYWRKWNELKINLYTLSRLAFANNAWVFASRADSIIPRKKP